MELYSTYIETDKFDEVVNFYEKVFEKKGNIYTKNISKIIYCDNYFVKYIEITT